MPETAIDTARLRSRAERQAIARKRHAEREVAAPALTLDERRRERDRRAAIMPGVREQRERLAAELRAKEAGERRSLEDRVEKLEKSTTAVRRGG